jgi:hypothetical protein
VRRLTERVGLFQNGFIAACKVRRVHENFHFTVNANGTVTASMDNFTTSRK